MTGARVKIGYQAALKLLRAMIPRDSNDLFFVGMIQQMGGFRPDAMNFRNDSAKLVYEALKSSTAAAATAPAEPAKEPAH